VERVLEGFAFLAARVHLKIDAEFPRFTQSMIETLYPHYLSPTPSMVVVQVNPDPKQKSLDKGHPVPRGTVLRSLIGKNELTPCRYLTAHDLSLRPLEVGEAAYHSRAYGRLNLPKELKGKAAIQLSLKCASGRSFKDLKDLDDITVHLRGGETAMMVYEQFFARCTSVVLRAGEKKEPLAILGAECVSPVGFGEKEALLLNTPRSFQGYRLLHEYFTIPERFMFVKLSGLAAAVSKCTGDTLDIFAVMSGEEASLDNAVDASNFALHCTPAVNLFPHRADRASVSDKHSEILVVPDRTRPLDYEVYFVTGVTGHGADAADETLFRPFYSSSDVEAGGEGSAYFVVNRVPRPASARAQKRGPRSSYTGSDVYLSLVDPKAAPYDGNLKQISIETLCTNRDLPLQMPVGQGKTDFQLEVAAPVLSIRCVAGPTAPKTSFAEGEMSWRLISHLSLNYLSLVNDDEGATRLRDVLRLYSDLASPEVRKQIDGVLGVKTKTIMRRVQTEGPISFARGLEIELMLDESGFEGTGVFLLGGVLGRFFTKYVSINSFTETVVKTRTRGEIMRWQPQVGQRHIL
jgi:type VI secretion system protein ImpG